MVSRQSESAAVFGPERFRASESGRAGTVGRSLLAVAVLLLVVVGVPVAMLTLAGVPPIPESVSLSMVTRAVSVEVVLGVLVWVVWLAWFQFTVCTVVELVSAVRGRGVPGHVPVSGGVQVVVRRLVIAALLIFSASGPAVAAPATAAAPAPAPAPAAAAQVVSGGGGVPSDTGAADAGAGAADAGADQQDGTVVGHVTYRLGGAVIDPQVGAQLVGRRVYVVQPPQDHYHDNLWDIAERSLGEGRDYQQIYDLNAGRLQPDGRTLELARLIQPGWYLVMPESATDVPRVEAVTTTAPAAPAPGPVSADQSSGRQQEQGGRRMPDRSDDVDDILPADVPALGALTAASVLAVLARWRRYGSWAVPDAGAGELERLLRVGADPGRMTRVDAVLRWLSGLEDPPEFYAVGVDDDSVSLFLTRRVPQAPAPWRGRDGGAVWNVERGVDIQVPDGPVRVGAGLVTVGRDERGADVLIDLSVVDGDVVVSGAPSVAAEVVSALAVELCTNPWSAQVRVVGVGLPPALSAVCGERLEVASDVAAAVGSGSTDGPDSGEAGSAGSGSADAFGSVGGVGGVLTGRSGRGDVCVVLAAGQEEAAPVSPVRGGATLVRAGGGGGRWRIEVDSTGSARVEPLGVGVRVTRASEADLESLGELFAADTSGRPPAPEPPSPPSAAALRSAPVRVRVLGPAVVSAPGVVEPERLGLLTEAVACLALHEEGLHPRVLGSMIWPLGATGDVVTSSIDRLRAWLGRDEAGADRVREDEEGRLVLSSDVVADWSVLRGLIARARRARERGDDREELRLLQEGLRLVRGPVCQGAEPGRYAWLARVRATRESEVLVADAAHRVAVLLGDHDPDGAGRAVEVGLRVVELDQRLWRDDLRLAAACGRDRLAARAEALLEAAGADDLAQVDPATAALVEDLAPGAGLGSRRRPA